MDFAAFDASVRWTYHKDKLVCADKLGYKYISEAMHDLYFNKLWRLADIAKVLDYGSAIAIKVRFKQFGWYYKTEPQGGNRNYYKLFGNVELLRKEFKALQGCKDLKKNDLKEWYKQKAKLYSVHPETIKDCCFNRTWRNNS